MQALHIRYLLYLLASRTCCAGHVATPDGAIWQEHRHVSGAISTARAHTQLLRRTKEHLKAAGAAGLAVSGLANAQVFALHVERQGPPPPHPCRCAAACSSPPHIDATTTLGT